MFLLPSLTFLLAKLCNSQAFPNPGCAKLAEPPSGSICGVNGGATYPPIVTQTANNLQQCQNLCLRRQGIGTPDRNYPTCFTFNFNPNSRLCSIYPELARDRGFTPSSSADVFYEARCFRCDGVCPPAIGENLLDDSGFEASPSRVGPWFEAATYEPATVKGLIVKPGRNSAQAYRFPTQGQNEIIQSYNGCQDRLYDISLDYRLVHSQTTYLDMYISTGDLTEEIFVAPNGSSEWQTYNEYFYSTGADPFPVGNPEKLIVQFFNRQGPAPESIMVDNFRIAANNKTLVPRSGAPEKLVNGDFQNGNFSPWVPQKYNAGFYESLTVVRNALNFTSEPIQFPTVWLDQSRISGFVPGAEYLLQYRYSTTTSAYISPTLNFMNLDIEGIGTFKTISSYVCFNSIACSGTIKRPFVAREKVLSIRLNLGLRPSRMPRTNHTLILDDISIKRL